MSGPGTHVCPSCGIRVVSRGGRCAACHTPLEPLRPPPLPARESENPYEERGQVGQGIAWGFLLHLVQFPLSLLMGGVALLMIGLTQWIYLVPAMIVAASRGRGDLAKGMAIGGLITFLLNAACFGLVCGSL